MTLNASGNSPRRGRRGWTSGSEGTVTMKPIIIEKNPLEQLRIQRREYQGHDFVDLRLYFLGDDKQWHPTRKGITIHPDAWGDFMAALAKVEVDDAPPRRRGARS
jgi:hypothetical protein